MPRYTISPTSPAMEAIELDADDSYVILPAVSKLGCQSAKVFKDGMYQFDVSLSDSGVWSVRKSDQA